MRALIAYSAALVLVGLAAILRPFLPDSFVYLVGAACALFLLGSVVTLGWVLREYPLATLLLATPVPAFVFSPSGPLRAVHSVERGLADLSSYGVAAAVLVAPLLEIFLRWIDAKRGSSVRYGASAGFILLLVASVLAFGWLRAALYVTTSLIILFTMIAVSRMNELDELVEKSRPLAALLGATVIPLTDLINVVQGLGGVLDHNVQLADVVRVGFVLCGTSAVLTWAAVVLLLLKGFQRGNPAHLALIAGSSFGIGALFLMLFLEIAARWKG